MLLRVYFIVVFTFLLPNVVAAETDALALIQRVQDLLRSDTNISTYRIHIVKKDWQREMRVQAWDDNQGKRFFMFILSPRKDKGTTYLKKGSNLWMYLPKLERDIRIPPSMMLNSWMGSDFTNDDLVKSADVVTDYQHRLLKHEKGVYTIESLPHDDAAVVWGKLIHHISDEGIPISEAFYDEHGLLIRTMVYDQVKVMGGRKLPTRWTVYPQQKPEQYTVMDIEAIQFDVEISESVFKRSHMRRKQR